jgi:hypothetical protein
LTLTVDRKVLYRIYLAILYSILSTGITGVVYGHGLDTIHTSTVEVRQFDVSMIETFKADERFQYVQPPETRENWLKILFRTFMAWLVQVLGNEGVAWLVFIFMIVLGAVGLGFAFYGLFGIGKTFPVYIKDKEGIGYTVDQENIHEIDFPSEIERALAGEDYKKAIRLLYLFTLKLCTDNKLIEWKPSKTNHDYMYEIRDEKFQTGFSAISFIFDYVWYGDFAAKASHFADMQHAFAELEKNLTSHA